MLFDSPQSVRERRNRKHHYAKLNVAKRIERHLKKLVQRFKGPLSVEVTQHLGDQVLKLVETDPVHGPELVIQFRVTTGMRDVRGGGNITLRVLTGFDEKWPPTATNLSTEEGQKMALAAIADFIVRYGFKPCAAL